MLKKIALIAIGSLFWMGVGPVQAGNTWMDISSCDRAWAKYYWQGGQKPSSICEESILPQSICPWVYEKINKRGSLKWLNKGWKFVTKYVAEAWEFDSKVNFIGDMGSDIFIIRKRICEKEKKP